MFAVQVHIKFRDGRVMQSLFGPFAEQADAYPTLAAAAGRIDVVGAQIVPVLNAEEAKEANEAIAAGPRLVT